jgi:hypothetical protein
MGATGGDSNGGPTSAAAPAAAAPASALAANIAKKGANAYYYAHAKNIGISDRIHAYHEPVGDAVAYCAAVRHVIPIYRNVAAPLQPRLVAMDAPDGPSSKRALPVRSIDTYAWSDGDKRVRHESL